MQSLVVHPCPTFEGMGSAAHQLRLFHAKYRPELVLKRGLHTVYLQAGKCVQFKMLCVLVAVSGTTRHRLPSNLSLVVVVCQPTTSSGSELLRRIQLKHCACQLSSTVLPTGCVEAGARLGQVSVRPQVAWIHSSGRSNISPGPVTHVSVPDIGRDEAYKCLCKCRQTDTPSASHETCVRVCVYVCLSVCLCVCLGLDINIGLDKK